MPFSPFSSPSAVALSPSLEELHASGMGAPRKPPPPTAAADLESRPRRRRFTAADKLAILAELDEAPRGPQGAVLRKHGIYSSHVAHWRRGLADRGRAGIEQAPGPRPAPPEAARIRELEAQLAAANKELRIVHELNALPKKVSMLLGISLAVPPKSEDS